MVVTTSWIDLEGIVLSEIRQGKPNTVWQLLICATLKIQQISEYNIKEAFTDREQTSGETKWGQYKVGDWEIQTTEHKVGCCQVTSVVSDSVRPHGRQPTRIPCPCDSPGKSTGVGCHFLLQCMKVKSESEVAQSCSTPSNPMDCSLPGSSVHGIFQARVLEWGAIAFSKVG